METLKALALSLLNATVMLLIILLVLSLMLVGRLQDLAQDTRETLRIALVPPTEKLERIAVGVEKIQTGLSAPERRGNFSLLRTDIAELQKQIRTLSEGVDSLNDLTGRELALIVGQSIVKGLDGQARD